mgnify:CR=1 FL=1
MSFKTQKYQVIRGALSKELSNFIFNYMLLQQKAVGFMLESGQLKKVNFFTGHRGDKQVPGCYSKYADWVMETLLLYMKPVMKEKTGMDLVPTYSYTRLYEKGNILHRHKDRPSCEVSTTLHLGGDEWSIFLDPSGKGSRTEKNGKVIYKPSNLKGIQIDLKEGDMLIYSGCDLEHWREPFEGTVCSQVFLHYNHMNGPLDKTNRFDRRALLGVPMSVAKKERLH